jgi:hypothetical protein
MPIKPGSKPSAPGLRDSAVSSNCRYLLFLQTAMRHRHPVSKLPVKSTNSNPESVDDNFENVHSVQFPLQAFPFIYRGTNQP